MLLFFGLLYFIDYQLIGLEFLFFLRAVARKKWRKAKKFSTNVYFIKKKHLILQACLIGQACLFWRVVKKLKPKNDIFSICCSDWNFEPEAWSL